MPKPLAAHLTRRGKERQCHRCESLLPSRSESVYRGTRPYCPGCVDLCRNSPCGSRRSVVYADCGLCLECGRQRLRERIGTKKCRKCSAPMVRGASRASLCPSCRVSDQESWQRKAKKQLAKRRVEGRRRCKACGVSVGLARFYCDECRDRRLTMRAREGAKVQKRKRRARLHSVRFEFDKKVWEQVKAFFLQLCAYCGTRKAELTQEHVQPITRGGDHTEENIVPACRSCNCRKSDRTLLEWMAVGGLRKHNKESN